MTKFANATNAIHNGVQVLSSAGISSGVTPGNYGVLISNSTGVPSWLANGTTGQVLTATTSGNPSWSTSPSSSISLTGDTGGALTGSAFTVYADTAAINCGSSVSISGSGATLKLNVTDANSNTLIGTSCGNATTVGLGGGTNCGLGLSVLSSITTDSGHTAMGQYALSAIKGSTGCSAFGSAALGNCTSGNNNSAFGTDALQGLLTGINNVCLGVSAGLNYVGSESSNICIGFNTSGTAAESHVLRIGNATGTSAGNLSTAYIQGITGNSVSNQTVVTINSSTGQLGNVTSVPVANGGTGAATLTGLLTGNGTSAVSATAITQYNVLTGGATNLPNSVAPSATSGVPLVSAGSSAQPSFTTASSSGGGTGVSAPSAHTLPVAEGSSAFTFLGPLTNGQLLIGSTGADPVAATLTAGTGISITNAAGSITIAASGSSGITSVVVQTFASSGTYTPTSGMAYCTVECVGAGGGGGGVSTAGEAGGGGGGGSYVRGVYSAASIGASQSVTIGAVGSAGSNSGGAGGTGGSTTFGSLITAVGGSGGGGGTTSTKLNIGGVGGTGSSGGSFQTSGMPGLNGLLANTTPISGFGGSSFFGGGAIGVLQTGSGGTAGNNGTSYGGGGSGAVNSSSSAQTGGTGAKGFVVVTEYIA